MASEATLQAELQILFKVEACLIAHRLNSIVPLLRSMGIVEEALLSHPTFPAKLHSSFKAGQALLSGSVNFPEGLDLVALWPLGIGKGP